MTEARESAALLPCPNPWCIARTPPLPIRSRMASNGWHVACACGVSSWSKPTEAEAIAAWNTRAPTDLEAIREAAAPFIRAAEPIVHNDRERWNPDEWMRRVGRLRVGDFRDIAAAIRNTDFTKGEKG